MNKNKLNDAKEILDRLWDGGMPDDLGWKIRDWYADDYLREEKNAALEQLFEQEVRFNRTPTVYAHSMWQKLNQRLNKPVEPHRRLSGIQKALIVAAVVLPLLLAVPLMFRTNTVLPEPTAPTQVSMSTTPGQREHVTLPDGSQVWLNERSKITYAEDFEQQRNVQLTGEAFFDVAADDTKPFTVTTSELTITVTGTSFNVRAMAEEERETVSLYTGRVTLQNDDVVTPLEPEQAYSFDTKTRTAGVYAITDQMPEWMREPLAPKSLSTLLQEIGDAYGVAIQTRGRVPEGHYLFRATGFVSVDEALMILQRTSGEFSYTMQGSTVMIDFNQQR